MMGASERAWMGASELLLARRQRAVAAGRQRDAVRAAPASARLRGRQRVPLPRRQRAAVRGRQRAAAGRRQRAHASRARANACTAARASAASWAPASASAARARTSGASRRRGVRSRPELPLPRPAARAQVGTAMADRILLARPARPPAVRPPPRGSDGDGGAVAVRGDHRHVPAAAADVRGADRRPRPLPLHGVAVGAADHDADRRPPQAALRRAPRQADRARPRRRSSAPSPSRTTSGWRTCTTIASSRCATPGAATRAIWCARSAGCRRPAASRSITVDRDARLLPADGPQLGGIRAQVHVAADLYETPLRPPPARHVAGRMRLRPGRRRAAARGGDPLLLRRHARHPVRRPPPGLRRLRAAVLPERRGRLRPRHRVVGAGVERQGRLPGRSRTTATSTATSASTCRSTTSSRTSTPKGTACTPASSTTRSRTTSCTTSGSTTRTSRAARRACTPRTSAATARSRCSACAGHMDRPPIIVSPYDAELYGHWWYEGPLFLGDLFRQLHFDQQRDRDDHARATTWTATPPTRWRRRARRPGASRATTSYWLNETNAWTYRHLHVAGRAHGRAGAPAPERRRADRRARSTRRRAS